ncbi:hypothetical protein SDC9_188958 [bioreactor metagenome]|uniref:Uncharacterized protein n=1 Tax=bioreactor metagenome TaxID=1076179 RepID=A0A645HSF4_9ZZZZ
MADCPVGSISIGAGSEGNHIRDSKIAFQLKRASHDVRRFIGVAKSVAVLKQDDSAGFTGGSSACVDIASKAVARCDGQHAVFTSLV